MTKNTYKRLSDGSWGAVVHGTTQVGANIQVKKMSGQVKTEVVTQIHSVADGKTIVSIQSGQLSRARAYDNAVNEGGEGYNPYR